MAAIIIFTTLLALLTPAYALPFGQNGHGHHLSSRHSTHAFRHHHPRFLRPKPNSLDPLSLTPIVTSTTLPNFNASTSTQPEQSPNPIATQPRKYVVAHHMVGNTFPYTLQDWADDIAQANAAGIDGFALNVGRDDFQPARVADAYQAALQSGFDFKMFLSLDMASMPCATPDDATTLRNFVLAHSKHPNQLQYDNRAFVSTFAGESCTFGQSSVPEGWKIQFTAHPDLKDQIYFVPAFFIDPAKFADFEGVMDGDFNWNSGWPIELTTSFVDQLLSANDTSFAPPKMNLVASSATSGALATQNGFNELKNALSKFIGSTDSDEQHINGLAALDRSISTRDESGDSTKKKLYMAAVSPWFFTHYSPETFNKNFIFLSDQHLYSRRWESLIASRDQFDIVEILTWNDYGESHYVGPIKGAQPNSQAWVDGMNHTAWLELTEYYATAFKTGEYPTIEKDKVIMWSRPHPTAAQAPDPVGQPTNFELAEDAVWAVVMATEPAVVTLSTSPTSAQTFNVPAGISKISMPIGPGDTMEANMERDGENVLTLKPEGFVFQANPSSYNFNAFVTSATAQ